MKKLLIIEINDQGLFEKPPEKIMYVPFCQSILFTYIGKLHRDCIPFLVSNFKNERSKKIQIEQKNKHSLTLDSLIADYNYFEGSYDINLNWSCKIHFNQFGMYFFQIVFAVKESNHGYEAHSVIPADHFDYVIVNPSFTRRITSKSIKDTISVESIDSNERRKDTLLSSSANECPKTVMPQLSISKTEMISQGNEEISETNPLHNDQLLNFNSINIISLYPTMLGPFSEWESEFEALIANGFKAFHLFPIQKLGKSNSLQSISDPLLFNESIFGPQFELETLSRLLDKLRLKHQVVFVIDIIWNHCSIDSEWIHEEPECYYSVNNCPWLNAAFILDRSLNEISKKMMLEDKTIETISDVDQVMMKVRQEVFENHNFEELFEINVKETLNSFAEFVKTKQTECTSNKTFLRKCSEFSKNKHFVLKTDDENGFEQFSKELKDDFMIDRDENDQSEPKLSQKHADNYSQSDDPKTGFDRNGKSSSSKSEESKTEQKSKLFNDLKHSVHSSKASSKNLHLATNSIQEHFFTTDYESPRKPLFDCDNFCNKSIHFREPADSECVDAEDDSSQLPLNQIVKSRNSGIVFIDPSEIEAIKHLTSNYGVREKGVSIDFESLLNHFVTHPKNFNYSDLEQIMMQINQMNIKKVNEWIEEALENLNKDIQYRFLLRNVSKISDAHSLFQEYFKPLKNGDWVLINGRSLFSPSESIESQYFRRTVQVMSDSIRLNYQNAQRCPKLWQRMNLYTLQMASVFDGFRIRNYHQSKTETAKHFINNAMQVNQSLILISNFHSGFDNLDLKFCLNVGVHRFVRELQSFDSLGKIVALILEHLIETSHAANRIPAICENNYETSYLKPIKRMPILFDQSCENPSFHRHSNFFVQLPLLAITNFVPLMVGTCRGFDQMFVECIPNNTTKRYPKLSSTRRLVEEDRVVKFVVLNLSDLGFLSREWSTKRVQS
jgi:hypothetical protein